VGAPRVASTDLRDHADEARIARVWDRIERDLTRLDAPSTPRTPRLAYLAVAAALMAFGGGVLVGKIAFQGPANSAVTVVASTDTASDDELAQGSEGSTITLPGGATLTYPPGKRGTSKAPARTSRTHRPEERRARDPESAVAAEPTWIARVNADDYSGALELLRQQPGGLDGAIASTRSAQELMWIFTSARSKGGDQGAAIRALTRVIERFPDDPNAHVAAYQLGAMYERMGQNDQAKRSFAQCRSLAPKGALAEGALCAEVRIEKAQGRKDEARRMAQEYLAKYPGGQCSAEVESILQGDDGARDADAAL